jgi:hypothetical protein
VVTSALANISAVGARVIDLPITPEKSKNVKKA